MTIKANTTRHPEGRTCNVAGIIEGSDPVLKDEVIIIGAHLDAVGNAGGITGIPVALTMPAVWLTSWLQPKLLQAQE